MCPLNNFRYCPLLMLVLLGLGNVAFAEQKIIQKTFCVFTTANGAMKQVSSLEEVPPNRRDSAKCFSQTERSYMAKPEEIKLDGNIRRENMTSPIGQIELRWPRKIELLFGRTPERALVDAAQTVNRVIKKPGFPANIQQLNLSWKVVFMDENLPETQIPAYLVTNCHPGWMTPPANIYIVAQRVSAGCSEKQHSPKDVADSQLAQVLIHEMGHAVEHQLLKGNFAADRLRAEGFAMWFEAFASDSSTVIAKGQVRSNIFQLARQALQQPPEPFIFNGTPYDYARASMFFHVIVERRNLPALFSVYETMLKDRLEFFPAIDKRLGWDTRKLDSEVKRLLGG